MSIVYIYLLKDPITDEPKFIGFTRNLDKLRRQHPCKWGYNSNPKLKEWLQDLVQRSLRPQIEFITQAEGIKARWTRAVITKSLINKGHELLNKPSKSLAHFRMPSPRRSVKPSLA